MDPITLAVSVGTAVAAAAGSYGASKATLNGTKERVERIEQKIDKHIDNSQTTTMEVSERLTRIETKIEE